MARNVMHIDMSEQLRDALRFAAARDGLAPSQKARQILQQQMYRTMQSKEFLEHCSLAGLPLASGEDALGALREDTTDAT
jgi:hypothetical protein